MSSIDHVKTIKTMIGQTPLIINPDRDGPRFQQALSGLSEAKLEHLYRNFNSEERRRFHYVANMCLGYEAWCQLFKVLVVTTTQERLADRMEEAYAVKAQELGRREAELEAERLHLGQQLMDLEAENLNLRREKEKLAAEISRISNERGLLLDQQRQTQEVLERYRRLIAELKAMVAQSAMPAQQLKA
jgi:DNA anti-recombination protein RmuC